MDDYSAFYAALGVDPDTDWETLRRRYRRLMGQWHPDRFSGDTASREIAEERSKQITIAYQALWKYKRQHGVLPPRKPAMGEMGAPGPRRHARPVPDGVRSNNHEKGGEIPPRGRLFWRAGGGRGRGVAFAFFVVPPPFFLPDGS